MFSSRRNFIKSVGLGVAGLGLSTAAAEEKMTWGSEVPKGEDMLSLLPVNLSKVKKEDVDREILRAGIVAELDAINFYEQMAAMTENGNIRKVLLDIAKEEKTHMGEFQAFLLKEDKEQKEELKKGEKEVEELIGK